LKSKIFKGPKIKKNLVKLKWKHIFGKTKNLFFLISEMRIDQSTIFVVSFCHQTAHSSSFMMS